MSPAGSLRPPCRRHRLLRRRGMTAPDPAGGDRAAAARRCRGPGGLPAPPHAGHALRRRDERLPRRRGRRPRRRHRPGLGRAPAGRLGGGVRLRRAAGPRAGVRRRPGDLRGGRRAAGRPGRRLGRRPRRLRRRLGGAASGAAGPRAVPGRAARRPRSGAAGGPAAALRALDHPAAGAPPLRHQVLRRAAAHRAGGARRLRRGRRGRLDDARRGAAGARGRQPADAAADHPHARPAGSPSRTLLPRSPARRPLRWSRSARPSSRPPDGNYAVLPDGTRIRMVVPLPA